MPNFSKAHSLFSFLDYEITLDWYSHLDLLIILFVVVVHLYILGHEEKSLVLPDSVSGSLQSHSNPPKAVVGKMLQNLQLDNASLTRPEPETKKWIRCLARNAKYCERTDVVKYLRENTPAGTTGKDDFFPSFYSPLRVRPFRPSSFVWKPTRRFRGNHSALLILAT